MGWSWDSNPDFLAPENKLLHLIKVLSLGIRKMVLHLKALAALAEFGSYHSFWVVHSYLQRQLQGTDIFFPLTSDLTCRHTHTHVHKNFQMFIYTCIYKHIYIYTCMHICV